MKKILIFITLFFSYFKITNAFTGGLNESYSGAVIDGLHSQLLIIQNGEILVNYNTFGYLLLYIMIGILLFKTLIKFIVLTYTFGFYLTSGKKIGKD